MFLQMLVLTVSEYFETSKWYLVCELISQLKLTAIGRPTDKLHYLQKFINKFGLTNGSCKGLTKVFREDMR